jgi:hypothetical protein
VQYLKINGYCWSFFASGNYYANFCYFYGSNAYKTPTKRINFAVPKCTKSHVQQCENQNIFLASYSWIPAYSEEREGSERGRRENREGGEE